MIHFHTFRKPKLKGSTVIPTWQIGPFAMLLLPIMIYSKEVWHSSQIQWNRLVDVDVEGVDTKHVDLNNVLTSLVKDVK
jgi:hypothetical protein